MDELVESLNKCLSDTFVMYYKAHAFHWNVEGVHFSQYHAFFGELYEELFAAVDPIAENIRKLQAYAPISLTQLYRNTNVTEEDAFTNDAQIMVTKLLEANNVVLTSLNTAFKSATDNNKQGVADFLAGRIDTHEKHGWMLRVSTKGM